MLPLFPACKTLPRILFLDMNAFYAACEQQECPDYRGQPVAVVPMLTDYTCVIAASYEARALGIKTGSQVGRVKNTPGLHIVEARPELYLRYHACLLHLLEQHFVTMTVYVVDEVACRVPQRLYKTAAQEETLARRLKACIADELGPYLRRSIGIGPPVGAFRF